MSSKLQNAFYNTGSIVSINNGDKHINSVRCLCSVLIELGLADLDYVWQNLSYGFDIEIYIKRLKDKDAF